MLANGTQLPHFSRHVRVSRPGGLHTFNLPSHVRGDGEKAITIRLADCDGERSSASMLINRKYSGRGYGSGHRVPSAGNCVTFTASTGDSVIGTLSLTVDSAQGLASDKTFKDELDEFRKVKGAKICELTKFAFDTSKPSLHLLASLFHIIFIYGTHKHHCTDLFIEVNPRHRRFYEAMLGFKSVGAMKTNDAVGAPSHLMWLKVSDIRRHIDEHAGKASASQHSLYPYFFSKAEELGIYNRLVGTPSKDELLAGGFSQRDAAGLAARLEREQMEASGAAQRLTVTEAQAALV